MSQQRDLWSSEWFHVVQKGADAQDIFSAASHRSVYEELTVEAFHRFGVELHAYAWMTNHVHELLHAPTGGLPEAMHRIGSRYAALYNGWTDRPEPEWLQTGVVADGFDHASYQRYVLATQPSDRFGSGLLPPLTATSCDEIEAAVAVVVGRPIDELRSGDRRIGDDARTLMITLAVELRVDSSDSLAKRYGLSDLRSVRRVARRGRLQATQSPGFAALRGRVLAQLDSVPGDPGWGNRGGFPETWAGGTEVA